MAQPATHIQRTRAAITRLCDAFEQAQACVAEYNAIGGDAGVHPFWLNPDGTTRTDYDITEAQYTAAIGSINAIAQTVIANSNNSNLYLVKG